MLLPPSEKSKIQEISAKNQRRGYPLAFYFTDVISFALYGFLYLLHILFQFLRLVLSDFDLSVLSTYCLFNVSYFCMHLIELRLDNIKLS